MFRWLFFKTVREAVAMRKHVHRWYRAQQDLLTPQAIGAITLAMNELRAALKEKPLNKGRIRIKMEEMEFAANKWLKPYANPVWRENVEVLLVAIAVAMGIRTFFIQPFKIPTGSMQPTLYGVTSTPDFTPVLGELGRFNENRMFLGGAEKTQFERKILAGEAKEAKLQAAIKIPNILGRIEDWFRGISYVHFVAPTEGKLEAVQRPWPPAFFSIFQRVEFAGKWYTIWFPPDYGEQNLETRAGFYYPLPEGGRINLLDGHVFQKGQDVIKLRVHAGDHLFVDRMTYNFRQPRRGEIVVFETKGIPEDMRDEWNIPANEFYIKRLVGLGGETLSIHQDYQVAGVPFPQIRSLFSDGDVPVGNLVVDGRPLSASTRHFSGLYSFSNPPAGTKILQYKPNHYYGHAMLKGLASGKQYHVAPGDYFVMGDNTMNSLDSRYWGDFPSQYVVGKSFFVYWPITKRFGWGNQ